MILKEHHDRFKHFGLKIAVGFVVYVLSSGRQAHAQEDLTALEKRVSVLEDYVSSIQPTMVEFSDSLNNGIQEYTKGLESSLENYSLKLQRNLDERLAVGNRQVIILNPYSKEYQSIETNTGTFLLSVEKTETTENGIRLMLNIGNPNYADYQNFKLKFVWGSQWPGEAAMPHAQWRESLLGAEFSFQGKIERGKWNSVSVDLTPVMDGPLNYLECEMYVESVELDYK